MDPQTTHPEPLEHPHHVKPIDHGQRVGHPHHVKPIDPGYRLSIRTLLWVIAGAVLLGLCIWWVST